MIEFLVFIVGITALITFWSMFKKTGTVIEGTLDLGLNVIHTVNKTGDKSLKVYSRDIDIAIAKKKQEQFILVTDMGKVPTDKEIDDLLEMM